MHMKSIYINTDLDIVSSDDLNHLVESIRDKCELLQAETNDDGSWYIRLEANDSGIIDGKGHNPIRDIKVLLNLIESLDEIQKKFLARAKTFDFNIGWQASKDRPEGSFCIPNDLLQRMSNIGATLSVTVYPSNENDYDE